jgi:biotin transporter BioY
MTALTDPAPSVLVVGATLGSLLGAASMLVYLLAG